MLISVNTCDKIERDLLSKNSQTYFYLAASKHKVFTLRKENGEGRRGRCRISFLNSLFQASTIPWKTKVGIASAFRFLTF